MENRKAKVFTYMIQLQDGNIRGNIMEVLEWISRNPGTTVYEMRTALHMAHQSLTPSVSNLLDCGLIREIGQIRIKDSIYSKYDFVPDSIAQDDLAEKRKGAKYDQWIKQGIKEFGDYMPQQLLEILEIQL